MTYWLFFQDLVTENTKMPKKIGCRFRHYWRMITVKGIEPIPIVATRASDDTVTPEEFGWSTELGRNTDTSRHGFCSLRC